MTGGNTMKSKWKALLCAACLFALPAVSISNAEEPVVQGAVKSVASTPVGMWKPYTVPEGTPVLSISGPDEKMGIVLFGDMGNHLYPLEQKTLPESNRKELESSESRGFYAVVSNGGKSGVIKEGGEVVIPVKYENPGLLGKEIFLCFNQGQAKAPDMNGKETAMPEDPVPPVSSFKEGDLYGFKNDKGEVLIPPSYSRVIQEFSEGLAIVKNKDGKKTAINEKGEELFPVPYDVAEPFQGGLAAYYESGSEPSVFHDHGIYESIVNNFAYYRYYAMGKSPVFDGMRRGYMDRNGNSITGKAFFNVAAMASWGTAVEMDKGDFIGLINRKGGYLLEPGPYELTKKYMDDLSGLLPLKQGKYGLVSVVDGTVVVPFEYDDIDCLGSGRLLLTKGDVKYFLDIYTGKVITEVSKDTEIRPFVAAAFTWAVTDKGKTWQIIDREGHILYTAPAGLIEEADIFHNDYTPVKVKGKWGVMDDKGNWTAPPAWSKIHIL